MRTNNQDRMGQKEKKEQSNKSVRPQGVKCCTELSEQDAADQSNEGLWSRSDARKEKGKRDKARAQSGLPALVNDLDGIKVCSQQKVRAHQDRQRRPQSSNLPY